MRRAIRTPLLSVAATAAILGPAAAAPAATVVSEPGPAGARTFADGAPGWTTRTDRNGFCLPLICPAVSQSPVLSGGTGGAGDGFIRTRIGRLVNVLSEAQGVWRSPAFTPAAPVDRATFSLALRSDVDGLVAVNADAALDVVLVDLSDPARSTSVLSRTLSDTAGFTGVSATLPAGAVVPGRSYRLEVRTRVGQLAAVPLVVTTDVDDVELQLADLLPPSDLSAAFPAGGVARVEGSVDPNGQATSVTVDYGTSAGYGSSAGPVQVTGDGARAFTIPLAGLNPGTTYHFRAVATNLDGSISTSDGTFVAPGSPTDGGGGPGTGTGTGTPGGSGTGTPGGSRPGTGSANGDPGGYASILGACYRSDVAITQVRKSGRRVRVAGIAALPAGTRVAVRAVGGRRLGGSAVRADGTFRATVRPPAARRGKQARVRAHAGTRRSNAVFVKPANALTGLRVGARTVIVRGRVNVARLGAAVRFTARGGRGAAACARGGRKLEVRGVQVDRRTGAYRLSVRVPAGVGRVAVRTRALGRFTAYSAFGIR